MTNVRRVLRVTREIMDHPANAGRRPQAFAQVASFQIRTRALHRAVPIRYGSGKILADRTFRSSHQAVYGSPPDWNEMQAWSRLLGPGSLFVDVGANVGTYSLWAASQGADVIAIEPHGATCDRLRANLALNGITAQVEQVAVSDHRDRVRLTNDLDVVNHLIAAGAWEGFPTQSSIEVDAMPLDEIIGDRYVTGMKIDVEGAEELALRGARHALAEHHIQTIQLEWNDMSRLTRLGSLSGVGELLREYGFQLARPDARGALQPIGWEDGDRGTADVFAIQVD